jgi:hypothetical protein|nr:hypothetical protein TR92_05315 [Brucella anthropi]
MGTQNDAVQISPPNHLFQLVARKHHGDAASFICRALNCLCEIYDDDIARLGPDVDAVEIAA